MKKLALILFIISFSVLAYAQDSWSSLAQVDTNNTIITQMERGTDFIICAGHYKGSTTTKPFISKYTDTGELIWTKEIDAQQNGTITELKIYNGHIYLAGQEWGSILDNRNVIFLKLDLDGELEWAEQQIGQNWTFSYYNRFFINDMHIRPDGSILFVGAVTQSGAVNASYHLDPVYGLLDSDQNLSWCKNIPLESTTHNLAYGIHRRNANEYLILGRSEAYVSADSSNYEWDSYDGFIGSIDTSGNINYINSYDKQDYNEVGNYYTDIVPSEGSYYAIGKVNPYLCDEGCSNGIITKFDLSGNLEWSKIINRIGGEFNNITAFCSDENGGLLIASEHYGFFGVPPWLYSPADAVISHISAEGELIATLSLDSDDDDTFLGLAIDEMDQVYYAGEKEIAISYDETLKKIQMGRVRLGSELCNFSEDAITLTDYLLDVSSQPAVSITYQSTQIDGPEMVDLLLDYEETCRSSFSYVAVDGFYSYTDYCPTVDINLLENDLFSLNIDVIEVIALNTETDYTLSGNNLIWQSSAPYTDGQFQYIGCNSMNVCDTAIISISYSECMIDPSGPINYDTLIVEAGVPVFIPIDCEVIDILESPSSVILGLPGLDGFYVDPPVDFNGIDMFSYSLSAADSCCPMVCAQHEVLILGPSSINHSEVIENIYPVPVKDIINLPAQIASYKSFQIYKVNGGIVGEGDIYSDLKINVSDLNRGLYLLSLITSERTITYKFIKE